MDNAEKQIIELFKDDNTNITREGIKYIGEMVIWILDLIKLDFETNKDIMTPEGYIIYFDMDNIRYNLGISKLSSFYSYSEFNICILQPLVKLMYIKNGFDIRVEGIDNPVHRFKMIVHKIEKDKKLIKITKDVLEQSNIIKEFSEICNVVIADDGDYNIDNIIEMCKCTDKLQKYDWNIEAVNMAIQFMQNKNSKREEVIELKTEDVKEFRRKIKGSKHYSKKYVVDVIYMWIKDWSFEIKHLQDGLYPIGGTIINVIAPKMKDLLYSGEYEADVKLIESKIPPLTQNELLSNLRQRFISWINHFNKECIKAGLEPPFTPKNKYITKESIENVVKYGSCTKYIEVTLKKKVEFEEKDNVGVVENVENISIKEEPDTTGTSEVNIPFMQIPEDVTIPVEYTTTVAEAELHTYNVTFKYKLGGLFSRYLDFSQRISGFTDTDAYCNVLPIFYKDKRIKDVKINNSSIIITQMD